MNASQRHAANYAITANFEDLALAKAERKLAQSLPSVDPYDPDFRRLTYVRYADDWLIGFAGPYREAAQVRSDCRECIQDLGLNLNMNKTKITQDSAGGTFLGAKIHVPLGQQRFKAGS